jgi:hypothetical protein
MMARRYPFRFAVTWHSLTRHAYTFHVCDPDEPYLLLCGKPTLGDSLRFAESRPVFAFEQAAVLVENSSSNAWCVRCEKAMDKRAPLRVGA